MSLLRFPSCGIVAAMGVLLAVGCGGSSDKKDDPAGDAGPGGDGSVEDNDAAIEEEENPPLSAADGEVAIRVDQARRASSDGDYGYVYVAFTLANGANSPPASLNLALFSVKTSDGLYVAASVSSPYWVDAEACNPAVSVGGGASASCALTFELEDSATPVELFYQTAGKIAGTGSDQRSATAALTLEPCTQCGTDCTYLDYDPGHCGACDNALELAYGDDNYQDISLACRRGKPVCPVEEELTLCETVRYDPGVPGGTPVYRCTDIQTSERNCGACGKVVEHGECIAGQPTCGESETPYTTCGEKSYCVDLVNDRANCGTCGHSCEVAPAGKGRPSNGHCGERVAGQCADYFVSFQVTEGAVLAEGDTCAEVCAANGYEGCIAESDRCSNAVGTSGSIECPCFW
jgi:hypothetical protein